MGNFLFYIIGDVILGLFVILECLVMVNELDDVEDIVVVSCFIILFWYFNLGYEVLGCYYGVWMFLW